MPQRHSNEDRNVLKRTLLQREANGYCFTKDDIAYLITRTQLTKAQIEKWAEKTRAKYPGNKLVAFLTNVKESKVYFFSMKSSLSEKNLKGGYKLATYWNGALSFFP